MVLLSEQIVGLLGVCDSPTDAMAQFDAWVVARTQRVRSAAAAGQPGLRVELQRLRAELIELRSVESPALRQSEALWLEGLITLIGEVATEGPAELRACA